MISLAGIKSICSVCSRPISWPNWPQYSQLALCGFQHRGLNFQMRRQRVASAPLLPFLRCLVVVLRLQDLVAVGRGTPGLILQVVGHRGQLLFLFLGELLGLGSKEQAFELLDQRVLFGDPCRLLGNRFVLFDNRLSESSLQVQPLFHKGGQITPSVDQQFVSPVHELKRSRNWRWSG